jgi:hypothetical protein
VAPAAPGAGSVPLSLATPSFYLLVATLGLFVVMLFVLRAYYPNRKRGFEGYLEAAGVSLAFLVFGVALVVALVWHDPQGNLTSWALYQTILTGYWLAFSIPVVTVGSSVQARSRGAIRWVVPSIVVSVLMFLAIFAYYYTGAG